MLVEDGQTLVLGGLIDDQITDVEEKVPLLGDIPLLGQLFRYRSTQKSKRNLMIFLHPQIMRDADTASQYSNAKYNFVRSRQMLFQENEGNNTEKGTQELPELKFYFEGRDVNSPLTQLESPVLPTPSDVVSVPTLKDGTKVIGLSAFGTETTASAAKTDINKTSIKKTDIEKVIATYNEQQADEVLALESDAVSDHPPLPPIEIHLVESLTETLAETLTESISPAAIAPVPVTTAAVTTALPSPVEDSPVDELEVSDTDQTVAAEVQEEETSLQEIPASSKTVDGVSVRFGVVEDTDALADDDAELIADQPSMEQLVAQALANAETLPNAEMLPYVEAISDKEILDTPKAMPEPCLLYTSDAADE